MRYSKEEFLQRITTAEIAGVELSLFGFDTIAIALDIGKEEAKALWNANSLGLKRLPRTEFQLKRRVDLEIKYKSHKALYELVCDEYLVFYLSPSCPVYLPNGMITDLGSIPLLLRWVIDKDDIRGIFAFLFHDIECSNGVMTRLLADTMLREIMVYMHAPALQVAMVYKSMRLFTDIQEMVRGIAGYEVPPIDLYNRELVAALIEKLYTNEGEQEKLVTLNKLVYG